MFQPLAANYKFQPTSPILLHSSPVSRMQSLRSQLRHASYGHHPTDQSSRLSHLPQALQLSLPTDRTLNITTTYSLSRRDFHHRRQSCRQLPPFVPSTLPAFSTKGTRQLFHLIPPTLSTFRQQPRLLLQHHLLLPSLIVPSSFAFSILCVL